MVATRARTRTVWPMIRTSGAPSTGAGPSPPVGWNPTIITVVWVSSRCARRWWRMRPPVIIPEPAMMIAASLEALIAFDSSTDWCT